MKKLLVILMLFSLVKGSAFAQVALPASDIDTELSEATDSASASGLVEVVVEKKPDLTEPEGEVKSKLESVLEENPVEELKWNNFIRYTIFQSVKGGVPVNTIVLVLLFPLVAAIVVASRHLVGLVGLGIFTPSLLAIGFLATGIGVGVLLFITILLVATISRMIIRRFKLQYLPRMALLLWFISLGVFVALAIAARVGYDGLITVGIFPILILMLLAEDFIDVQVGRSFREASSIMTSTFALAILASFIVGLESVQRAVLLYPEIVFFGVGIFDFFMARYVGLRLMEYFKFRPIFTSGDDEE